MNEFTDVPSNHGLSCVEPAACTCTRSVSAPFPPGVHRRTPEPDDGSTGVSIQLNAFMILETLYLI